MTPKIFVDADVLLDILLAREPHFDDSYQLFLFLEKEKIQLVTSVSVILNINYIAEKNIGKKRLQKPFRIC